MANLSGTWKFDHDENFDEYLKAIGMGVVKRKMASATTPIMEIKQDGTKFYIKMTTSISTQVMDFTVGEPFLSDIPGITTGKWNASPSWDGSKLTVVATPGPEDKDMQPTTIIRELAGNGLVVTYIAGDVKGKRYYFKKA